MLKFDITWTSGIILLFLFYYIKIPLILMLLTFDGFIGTFTKYHIGLILSMLVLFCFGWASFFFVKICVLVFLLIKNIDHLIKKYTSLKKCLNAMIKLTKLTNIQSDELDMMEYTNNKIVFIDEKYNYVNNKYTTLKNNALTKFDNITNSELCKDFLYCCSVSDMFIENSYYFIKNNFIIVGEILYHVPICKKYTDKYISYYGIGSDMYSKSNGDNILESTDLKSSLIEDDQIGNMNIDMSQLGDIAGMMTDFLDTFTNDMKHNLEDDNMFKLNDSDLAFQSSKMSLRIDDCDSETEYTIENENKLIITGNETTLLDDETLLDDDDVFLLDRNFLSKNITIDRNTEKYIDTLFTDNRIEVLSDIQNDNISNEDDISELLEKGDDLDDEIVEHAFKKISDITSSNQNDTKILLKKKNKKNKKK